MITDYFLDLLSSMVVTFFELFPSWAMPSWYETAVTGWGSIVSGIADLAHWVPLDAVAQVAIAVGLVSAFAFGVRVMRIVLSFISGGGGA